MPDLDSPPPRQPFLHRSVAIFRGSTLAWSPSDGQIRHGGWLAATDHRRQRLLDWAFDDLGAPGATLIWGQRQ